MSTRTERRVARRSSAVACGIAVLLGIFGILPIANWIPGGHDATWYGLVASGWLSGTAIVVGIGIVLAILSRRIDPLWRDRALDGMRTVWSRHPRRTWLVVAAAAFAAYCIVALTVFDGRPLLIDELVQVLQAQILAAGHLSRPVFSHPEFFSTMHVVDVNGRYFSQFPIGGPAMLTIGVLLHATWLVGPLFGAASVIAFAIYMRTVESRPGVALGATLLFAFAPFVMFMSGSQMNHVPTLAWVMIAVAALARVVSAESPRPWLALISGLGFGIAATIRPVDALAFALPAGVWYLWRAIRDSRRWVDTAAAGIGVLLPVLVLLWVNRQTTGAPFLFGYQLLWGKNQGLGFHAAPWGAPHTPARGVELVSLYFLRLQTYLFETPAPSLIPLIAALALTRRFDRFDRYLLTSSGLLVTLYFAYWFDGFYLGPRFMYLLVPAAALWTARFLPLIRDRFGNGLLYRSTVYASMSAGVLAAVLLIPMRAMQYSHGLVSMRWNADSAAAAGNVRDALVLVRESWGSQLVTRLWALGVPRSETETLYRNIDSCILDSRVTALEQNGVHGMAAFDALRPLLRDSSKVIGSPFSPDTTEQFLPGATYSPRCIARINDDRAGITVLTPLLLSHGGDNVYARDLHGRDSLLVRAYPGRPVYLLRPVSNEIGAPPRFYRAPNDSLWAAWRSGDSLSILSALGTLGDQQQATAMHTSSPSVPHR